CAAGPRGAPGGDQAPAAAAPGEGTRRKAAMALREPVEAEGDLLGRLEAPVFATEDRVLLALLRARVVDVVAPPVRDGRVVLLDPAEHLGVERRLERSGRGHHLVGVGVLGPEVREDLGVVPVPEPGVVVLATVAVDDVDFRDFLRDGRCRHGRQGKVYRLRPGFRVRSVRRWYGSMVSIW